MGDSLFLLIRSVQASASAVGWTFLFLLGVQIVGGMFLHQILLPFMFDSDFSATEDSHKVFKYFGTFSKTMATMFEITFANWVPSCRTLMDLVDERFILFYIFYRCLLCFAILRVIAAVFIAETNRLVGQDIELNIKKRAKALKLRSDELKEIFAECDSSGNGCLSLEEFKSAFADPVIKQWAGTMDIETDHIEETFELMQRAQEEVNIADFLDCIAKMKHTARSHEVAAAIGFLKEIDAKVAHMAQRQVSIDRRLALADLDSLTTACSDKVGLVGLMPKI